MISQKKVKIVSQTQMIDNVFPVNSELRDCTSMFGALTDAQMSKLFSYADRKTLGSGERVFEQGDLPTSIYIVITGRIDLVVRKNGIYSLEATFQAGDSLGETALVGIQPEVGSAIVVGEEAELLELPKEAILDLYEQDNELYGLLMMNIARDLSRKLHSVMKSL